MADLTVVPVVDEGLGNSAYLVDLGDGRALAVDASRDLRELRRAADARGLRVAYAADTHLHADFVTGACELAARDGARILASAAGGRAYPHAGLVDGDEVDLGGLTLRALATPGHTHEHLAFQLLDGPRTLGVFSGGSLLVGSAARTDLVAPERSEELARAQYRSLQRLALLDDVALWPTHGAGSFCSAPPGSARTSTIGTERAGNALLRAASEDAFVTLLLGSLGTYPSYFARLGELNRRGPALVGDDVGLAPLDVSTVERLRASGAEVVDVRPFPDFADGHLPRSVSIQLRGVFATWLGWLVDSDRPLVFVRNADQDPAEIVWQSLKVGYDRLAGELSGGMDAWRDARRPSSTLPVVGLDMITVGPRGRRARAVVLDVRQASEFAAGHVPGARNVELGALTAGADAVPDGAAHDCTTVVMCGHGERAMSAASMIARSRPTGTTGLAVLAGGPAGWSRTTGAPLETGA